MNDSVLQDALVIPQFIQRAAAALDAEQLPQWLEQFDDPDGVYEISAFSTELRRQLAWWRQELPSLRKTLSEVPRHVRDPARRLRVLGIPLLSVEGDLAHAQTSVAIYRTLPTGETSLFAVGRYHDDLVRTAGGWRFRVHRLHLDTRVLDAFTHLPL